VPVCLGCRAEEGCVAVVGEPVCATYNCAVNKKALDFCYQCEDFPCLKLAPCADRAQEIPHNSKIYNLLSLQKLGLEGWLKPCADRAQEIPHNSKIYNLLSLQKLGLEGWLKSADSLWGQYFKGKKPRPGDDVQI